jgi:hypothetical protein
MYQPWVAHWFPGVTLEQLEQGSWTLAGWVAMGDFVRDSVKG